MRGLFNRGERRKNEGEQAYQEWLKPGVKQVLEPVEVDVYDVNTGKKKTSFILHQGSTVNVKTVSVLQAEISIINLADEDQRVMRQLDEIDEPKMSVSNRYYNNFLG
jgi:hypothetical protein